MMFRAILFTVCLYGQDSGLDLAYSHQRAGRLAEARFAFEESLRGNPTNESARLDYAYLLLRMGETVEGRDQMRIVLKARPADEALALEYAYLAYETRKRAEAYEIFLRLKLAQNEAVRKQAQETWTSLETELEQSIARWTEAARKSPNSYSVHEELARLLEDRNDWVNAAAEYRLAFGLKPDKRSFLLDIARVEREALRLDYANAAILAASRTGPDFVAEEAREQLPTRYPFVYEFRYAIQMDPLNVPLRRELGFLLLKMKQDKDAIAVFEELLQLAPDDALSVAQLAFLRVDRELPPIDDSGLSGIRDLAVHSLEKGYLSDALRYLEQLYERDPADAATHLRLGWAYNMNKNDREALKWFDRARRSTDPKIAAEAERAYRNLRPSLAPLRSTTWMLPFYSSRWREVFAYGQAKLEFRLPFTSLRPYFSTRFIGDLGLNRLHTAGPGGVVTAQGLSENAIVGAVGLATPRHHGLMAWGEVGGSWQYFAKSQGTATIRPDYRGGLNFTRGFGAANLGSEGGWFATTSIDAVFLSRFNKDTLFYGQNRIGYHLSDKPIQFYVNLNLTGDIQRMDWANYLEIGPGVRWRPPAMPRSLYLFADAVYGRHLLKDIARPSRYFDLRAGVWYAFTY
ncbi:tetratricopeptide repeat protein [Bryobacter aggregatus]|uniref:tetratricopeptide repeat protein n=1 Tax=Bryobacter aggregatus TaxID=360054 RepID=UPI0004E186BB|nr:tetratricopeptide repeat protein [Bryobacter aggregatus]